MTVDEDPQLYKATFEKLMLEKLDGSILIECDSTAGDGCHEEAVYAGLCNVCRGTCLFCEPHYKTLAVASIRFGIDTHCSGCGARGPIETTFTFELLRSPE